MVDAVTLLVISPDYASHLLPLATLATAWRDAGERVVVATGPRPPDRRGFGFERIDLQLGRGSNPGVIRAEDQPADEADSLRGFFDATRRGMIADPALPGARAPHRSDVGPGRTPAGARSRSSTRCGPTRSSSTTSPSAPGWHCRPRGVPYGDVVLGHPSALPVAGEVYGFPPVWPAAFAPAADELGRAARAVRRGRVAASPRSGTVPPATLDPAAVRRRATPSPSTATSCSTTTRPSWRPVDGRMLPPHVFLGSTRREEAVDAEVEAWIAATSRSST